MELLGNAWLPSFRSTLEARCGRWLETSWAAMASVIAVSGTTWSLARKLPVQVCHREFVFPTGVILVAD